MTTLNKFAIAKYIHCIFPQNDTISHFLWGFPCGSEGKESSCHAGESGLMPGLGRSLEKGMTTHSSILAWRIPWTEEPGGLQPMGLKECVYVLLGMTIEC